MSTLMQLEKTCEMGLFSNGFHFGFMSQNEIEHIQSMPVVSAFLGLAGFPTSAGNLIHPWLEGPFSHPLKAMDFVCIPF